MTTRPLKKILPRHRKMLRRLVQDDEHIRLTTGLIALLRKRGVHLRYRTYYEIREPCEWLIENFNYKSKADSKRIVERILVEEAIKEARK